MNVRMWEHPATQENAGLARERGVELIGPDEGELAEGETGVGRMTEPEEIFAPRAGCSARRDTLAGRRVLVSAGGTREPLDAVRFVGNRSSGRMGVALAEEARRRGADVTLLAANLAVPAPAGSRSWRRRPPPSSPARRRHAPTPTSFSWPRPSPTTRPIRSRASVPRTARRGRSSLEPTQDMLAEFGESMNGTVLVGFAADEGEAGLERKRRMLAESTWISSSSTTSPGPTSASTRPRTRS